MAAPFALIESGDGSLTLFNVGLEAFSAEVVAFLSPVEAAQSSFPSKIAEALAPRAIKAAKTGVRQLSLFPLDARLLDAARGRSIDSISGRLEQAFGRLVGDSVIPIADAARLSISALACVIVRDKYAWTDTDPARLVDAALTRHGDYFASLAEWQIAHPQLVAATLDELGDGLDYSAIDARSINSVYERLFLTPQLRREFSIYQTDPRLAARVMEYLPVEEIPPDKRFVVDPACGSGNLLLAALERLENLVSPTLSPAQAHDWLKARIYGADIEPTAVEIAKLSLLVSSLPLGNSWSVETRDALEGPATRLEPATIWVTNPPWHKARGTGKEAATAFISRAVEGLADGGLLACILPVGWLSDRQHRESRADLAAKCTVFETWRLPRDMFAPYARAETAVLFARKSQKTSRSTFAFSWVTTGIERRSEFLDKGIVQFQSISDIDPGRGFVDSPAEQIRSAKNETSRPLEDFLKFRGGVNHTGTIDPQPQGAGKPFLLRGESPPIYRSLPGACVTWIGDPSEHVSVSPTRLEGAREHPKLLVQTHRWAGNPWRVRPVVDTVGVVPSDAWQYATGSKQSIHAFHAYFSTAFVSCFVHGRCATKRISTKVLNAIPVPGNWEAYEPDFAAIGEAMLKEDATLAPLIDRADSLVARAFGLTSKSKSYRSVQKLMAGQKDADGRIRVTAESVPPAPPAEWTFNQSSGVVLDASADAVTVWALGGPEDGFTIDLPAAMPGWLMSEGMDFEITGTEQDGQLRFHRCAYLSDDEVLGAGWNDS